MNFDIKRIAFDSIDDNFLQLQRTLLKESSSPEKIFQTPEYFDFLWSRPNTRKDAVLMVVNDVESGTTQGLIPFRLIEQKFDFNINHNFSLNPRIKTVQILGSIPFLPIGDELLATVFLKIFALFPDVDGISLAAMPMGNKFDATVSNFANKNSYILHVLNGWRDSHIIPLPESFDAYLTRYNAKKRFNLKRQVRLLREHSDNTLQLHCIRKLDQIELYVNTWKQLAPPELTTHLLQTNTLNMLADKGLLHGYVLTIKGTPCGGIYATQAAGTLHIHNIIYAKELARFSVGACILYVAIEDLIQRGQFKVIDLGYSNPVHSEQASNVVEVRGNRLVLRKTWRNRILCHTHDFYLAKLPVIKAFLEKLRGKK